MDIKNNDLDVEYINFLKKYETIAKELPALLKSMANDLEAARKLSQAAEVQRQTFSNDTHKSISLECVHLQERMLNFQKQNVALKEKIDRIEYSYKTEIDRLSKMLADEKERVGLIQAEFTNKEIELKNDMLVMQTYSKTGYDEMEGRLLASVTDLTEKLHQSNSICNNLRAKNFSLQKQLNCSMENSRRLEEKLKTAEEKLENLQHAPKHTPNKKDSVFIKEPVFRNTNDGVQFHNISAATETSKYAPLAPVGSTSIPPNNLSEINKVFGVSSSRCRRSNYRINVTSQSKNCLPDLKQLSVAGNSSVTPQKKRKLYNPDDVGFIDKLPLE